MLSPLPCCGTVSSVVLGSAVVRSGSDALASLVTIEFLTNGIVDYAYEQIHKWTNLKYLGLGQPILSQTEFPKTSAP